MRGTNPIRKQVLRIDGKLEIAEVFFTIQGEGPFAGMPAVFVRASGCWARCFFCDTPTFEQGIGTFLEPENVLIQVRDAHQGQPCQLIVLTGGDPLRQNILPFCNLAMDYGYHVQIETAGLRWVPGLEQLVDVTAINIGTPGVSIVCSPKTGKVCEEMHLYALAWKYIISAEDIIDADDGLPNSSTQQRGLFQKLARPKNNNMIYVQPCDAEDPEKNGFNRDLTVSLAMRFNYRLSLQTHKILGLR